MDEHIKFLSPREHVRFRPGMYVGGTDARALHHLVYEVLDHMIEEALVGRCDRVEIELRDHNEISIRDYSAGLSVGQYKDTALTHMEALMQGIVGACKTDFEPDIYDPYIIGGLHGVGLWIVTFLCATMTVQNRRDGFLWEQLYEQGIPQAPLSKRPLDDQEGTGTTFIFTPDYTIFEQNDFDRLKLEARIQELSYLTPGLTITLSDRRVSPLW